MDDFGRRRIEKFQIKIISFKERYIVDEEMKR